MYFVDETLIVLNKLNIYTETTLWQFSVSELACSKVNRIMGVYGQVLVVVGEYTRKRTVPAGWVEDFHHRYIGLDIQSGSVKYTVDGYQLNEQEHLFNDYEHNYFVHQEGGLNLYFFTSLSSVDTAINRSLFITFDSQTGQTRTMDISAEIGSYDMIFLAASCMVNQHIYFSGDRIRKNNQMTTPRVGAFNIETLKIDWLYIFTDWEDGVLVKIGNPKVAGNKIYVHDTKNTLHILELEDEDEK
jgi:hypothetical protein